MFSPFRSSLSAPDPSSVDDSANLVLTLQSQGTSVLVRHDGFSIGTSQRCDLTLVEPSIPALHSVIHLQRGAIWIEAADDKATLIVNDRPYRRMALRHDDRLKIGATEFTILIQPEGIARSDEAVMTEDLALLTAEELCDRILSEQSMVAEFADGQRAGWDALLRAIEAANDEPATSGSIDELSIATEEQQVVFDALLGQIQELNEAITDRTRELDHREIEVLESTSMLEESQQRVSQRIDEILDHLNKTDPPNELRASA